VLTAACAFAVSPRVSDIGLSLRRELFGFAGGFTPAASPTHAPDPSRYETEGGVPGTYCPIPPRDGKPVAEASLVSATAISDLTPAASASSPAQSSEVRLDSLLAASPTKCTVPAAAAGPAPRPILP
jgi:hypothetical protein